MDSLREVKTAVNSLFLAACQKIERIQHEIKADFALLNWLHVNAQNGSRRSTEGVGSLFH